MVNGEREIKGACEGDVSIISAFFRMPFNAEQLVSLNTVRKFKGLLHASDILCCDGETPTPYTTPNKGEPLDTHIIPYEHPNRTDFLLLMGRCD